MMMIHVLFDAFSSCLGRD